MAILSVHNITHQEHGDPIVVHEKKTGRVLVLDGDQIHTLTIARSLNRAGLSVDVASHTERPLAHYSRCVSKTLAYPDPLNCESQFLAWCEGLFENADYDLVIPVTERTLVPMQRFLARADRQKLAIASPDALKVVLDKARTLELASELDVDAPRSRLVESMKDLSEVASFRKPVVLKPARSIGTNTEGRKQLGVEYANSDDEAARKVAHLLNFGGVILQEYFAGQGVGIELIADRGEVVYAFQHLRLHEVPLTGGGSSLRMSVPVEPVLLAASKRLIKALGWHGVAMVEFKWNDTEKTYSLMEINGRFWGSLPLAVAAGADFPMMLYELLVEGRVRPRSLARVGVYCRKLSSDMYWYEQVLRRDAPAGLVKLPNKGALLRDIGWLFSARHHFDVQSWRDPVPGMVDIARIVGSYFRRVSNYASDKRSFRSHRQAWRDKRILRRLADANQLLFVCYGNINRSALAERYFRSIVPETEVKVLSAGLHSAEGRPADPVMVETAGRHGIDMANWASTHVDQKMMEESDVILVMEHRHYRSLVERFPNADGRILLLGMVPNEASVGEIPDPYGKSREAYEHCVAQVSACVDQVARLVQASSR